MNTTPTNSAERPALNYQTLKERQREIRDSFPHSLSLRVHRALSWLKRAEQEVEDHDARFIFLWVAFNAAYSNQVPDRQSSSERILFQGFLDRLIDSDSENLLCSSIINSCFSHSGIFTTAC